MERLKAVRLEPGDYVTAPNVAIREAVEVDHIEDSPDGNTAIVHVHVKYKGALLALHHRHVKPVTHTVDSYFRKRISDQYIPIDATKVLNPSPNAERYITPEHSDVIRIDSPCGSDCKRAIDSAAELIVHIQAAHGLDAMEIHEVERAVHFVCCVYVNG